MRIDMEHLVLAAANGDAEAYGQLVDETSGLVSSIALAIVRDVELSRDVAQDVFLSVWRDLKNLRNPASFLPWLRQTVRNRAKTALRTDARRRHLGTPALLDDFLPVMMDPRPNVAEQMIAEEELRVLAEALASLPEETREVLTLFYREGQSVAQVASLLELSEVAVKKRLSRARASLRANLSDVGETLRRSAPTASFTAAVIAALPAAAPPSAAAATLAASKVSGGAFWMGALKLLAPFSGILLGGTGGILGVLFGSRKWFKEAQDEDERRALRCHTWVSCVVVLFYATLLSLSFVRRHGPVWIIGWFVCFIASLAVLQHVWLPRIVKRRMEAEMRRDPEGARARRRQERRQAIIGWTLGLIGGSLGLAVGLWSISR